MPAMQRCSLLLLLAVACGGPETPAPAATRALANRAPAQPVEDAGPGIAGDAGAMDDLYGTSVLGSHQAVGALVALDAGPGALDKDEIQRVIRSELAAVRHCYEKRLVVDPELAGRLQVQFTIGTDGSVIAVALDGLQEDVDRCVEKVIGSLRFPAPRGGGVVQVNYPFLFQPGGDPAADAGV